MTQRRWFTMGTWLSTLCPMGFLCGLIWLWLPIINLAPFSFGLQIRIFCRQSFLGLKKVRQELLNKSSCAWADVEVSLSTYLSPDIMQDISHEMYSPELKWLIKRTALISAMSFAASRHSNHSNTVKIIVKNVDTQRVREMNKHGTKAWIHWLHLWVGVVGVKNNGCSSCHRNYRWYIFGLRPYDGAHDGAVFVMICSRMLNGTQECRQVRKLVVEKRFIYNICSSNERCVFS